MAVFRCYPLPTNEMLWESVSSNKLLYPIAFDSSRCSEYKWATLIMLYSYRFESRVEYTRVKWIQGNF
eukprot:4273328-Amphidinium_carterae.1